MSPLLKSMWHSLQTGVLLLKSMTLGMRPVTLLEVPPLVLWVGFRIKSLVLRLCLCPLSPPVPLSVFSPHQASTPPVMWGQ